MEHANTDWRIFHPHGPNGPCDCSSGTCYELMITKGFWVEANNGIRSVLSADDIRAILRNPFKFLENSKRYTNEVYDEIREAIGENRTKILSLSERFKTGSLTKTIVEASLDAEEALAYHGNIWFAPRGAERFIRCIAIIKGSMSSKCMCKVRSV